jgi:polysaccharide export outer membrane protein
MKKLLSVFIIFTLLGPILGSTVLAFDLPAEALAKAGYTLATNDQLEIKIIGQKDMDTKQTIAPDGTIALPFLGRVQAQGKTLNEFQTYLTAEFAKYVDKPQLVVYLTPRSIYVIQHNLKTNLSEVKEAKSIAEAKAYAGDDYTKDIKYGDVITVDVGKQPDFFEENWYKIITATAVVVGIVASLNK